MAIERSLILIKPDAVARRLAGEILARIERRGLTLRAGKLMTVDRELADRAANELVLFAAVEVHAASRVASSTSRRTPYPVPPFWLR